MGSPLQEHHFVIGWNTQQFAQIGFGCLDNFFKHLGAVAHFHHRHAAPLIIQHFHLGLLEHGNG